MGTSYNIKLNHETDNIDSKLLKSDIDEILLQLNNQMSTYQEDSELSKINQLQTLEWINISVDLFTVINTAISISNKTTGVFDITIGPIVNLWGFGPTEQTEQIPTDENIAATLNSTGYQYLHLRKSPHALKKDKEDIYIDLSGIAKGYAVDKIAAHLDQLTVKNYMVEIGGEIKAKGVNQHNIPWKVGIEKPVIGHRSVQDIINLDNIAMATSGDYRNYFEKNGKYYSHTINPKTGSKLF
jgi:thiamine biosynthesis lipoprotein